MRRAVAALLLLSCSPAARVEPSRPAPPPPPPAPVEHANTNAACIAVGEEPVDVELEGTLRLGSDGKQAVLRLASPRCVTGMKRASVLTEVVVVSDGFDLRSVLDRRVRIRGEVIGDASDLDAPALVVVAHTVEDLPRRAEP